jgi:hypothetical protein
MARRVARSKSRPVVPTGPGKSVRTPALLEPFGGVALSQAAPITVGNTITSTLPSVRSAKNVVTVTGRDFVMAIGGIGSARTNWSLCGGMPMTPAALVASALRGYFNSHEKYKFKRLALHYISSSPTSLSGDVMLLYHVNRGGPKVDHTSNNFLSYAMSTPNAVLGPQWSNKSVNISPGAEWKKTDLLNSEDLDHQSDGEVLVYCRNTTNGTAADSPGYLLIDYSVEFTHLMTNPRLNTLPTNIFKWFNIGLRTPLVTCVVGERVQFTTYSPDGNTGTTDSAPAGDVAGCIYQAVLDLQSNYNPNGLNFSTCFASKTDDSNALVPFPVQTGTTVYLVSRGLPICDVYPTYAAALAGRPLVYAAAFTAVQTGFGFNLSLCGSVSAAFTQANIG